MYPGLPSHPQHELAKRQASGFGGMICFDLSGDYDRAARAFDRLRVIKRAASLGGVESLISLPVLTSHWRHNDEQLREAGRHAGKAFLVGAEDGGPVSGSEVAVKFEHADSPRVRQPNAHRLVVVAAGQLDLGAPQDDARRVSGDVLGTIEQAGELITLLVAVAFAAHVAGFPLV